MPGNVTAAAAQASQIYSKAERHVVCQGVLRLLGLHAKSSRDADWLGGSIRLFARQVYTLGTTVSAANMSNLASSWTSLQEYPKVCWRRCGM